MSPRKVRATPPPSRRPEAAPVRRVKAHPLAWAAAQRLARPGQVLIPQEDGSVLVVNRRR